MNINTLMKILNIDSNNADEILSSIIMYLRKSRKDTEYYKDESIEKTLQRHERELQELIKNIFGKPLPEENIYREVASGDTIEDRPIMQSVLSKIESPNIKAVLCIEIERLARGNTIDQGTIAQAFKYTNTRIWTPLKIYNLDLEDDLAYFEDGLYQARKYLTYTKRILSRGRIRSVNDGKYVNSKRPYGYERKKLINEKGWTLEIKEDEAKIIRLIFDMANENKGTSIIANELNAMGIKPMFNNIWTPACVRNILLNDIYIGKIHWNKRKTVTTLVNGEIVKSRPVNDNCISVKGLHQAIIDEEIFNHVNEKIKSRKGNRISKKYELQNPLAGLVKCGMCGRNMIRRPYMSGYKDGLMCSISCCKNVSSHLYLVEEKILNGIQEILDNYKNKIVNYDCKTEKMDINVKIEIMEKELSNLENSLIKACELLESGIYSTDLFLKRKKEIEDKKNDIILKIEEEKNIQKNNDTEKIEKMIPKIENCLKVYSTLSIKEKNELLSSVIERIEYLKVRGGRGYEDNFTLKIYPKI